MLLVKGDASTKSPDKMQQQLQAYAGWMEKWKGKNQYVEGSPFKTEGIFLDGLENEETTGEFLNPHTTIGGFIWIKAADLKEAKMIAKECPLLDGCGIYVRPFLMM